MLVAVCMLRAALAVVQQSEAPDQARCGGRGSMYERRGESVCVRVTALVHLHGRAGDEVTQGKRWLPDCSTCNFPAGLAAAVRSVYETATPANMRCGQGIAEGIFEYPNMPHVTCMHTNTGLSSAWQESTDEP